MCPAKSSGLSISIIHGLHCGQALALVPWCCCLAPQTVSATMRVARMYGLFDWFRARLQKGHRPWRNDLVACAPVRLADPRFRKGATCVALRSYLAPAALHWHTRRMTSMSLPIHIVLARPFLQIGRRCSPPFAGRHPWICVEGQKVDLTQRCVHMLVGSSIHVRWESAGAGARWPD